MTQAPLFPAFEAVLAFGWWLDHAIGRQGHLPRCARRAARGWLLRQVIAYRCAGLCRYLPRNERWQAHWAGGLCDHCARAAA